MACVLQKRPPRSQREILEALRCPNQVNVDQNSPTDEGQVNINPMVTSPCPSPSLSGPISNFDLTSMDQFMDDQFFTRHQSITNCTCHIPWLVACIINREFQPQRFNN